MATIASPTPLTETLAETLKGRRHRLADLIEFPIVLWSGQSSSRNFPANTYPFRASSHFLYFAGLPLEKAAIRLEAGKLHLFMDEAPPASALWHGPTPSRSTLAAKIGADRASPLAELEHWVAGVGTIAATDPATQAEQARWLHRPMTRSPQAKDLEVAQAIVALRLAADPLGLAEIRAAIGVTLAAHHAGMAATATATTEAQVRAAMESVILGHDLTCAYSSIVTVQGEVLHNNHYHHAIGAGDLLLADVGAETSLGWAADITRTWPVSGQFSPTQRDLYTVVLTAHDRAIAALRPGVEYRDIHLLAAQTIAEGLVDLGILQGRPEDLVAQDAHALFFPHGIGHLLGLDVHDMEDLGNLAGYGAGRSRSDRFGLGYLRLDRPLQAGMVVTIEPGFYQVPAILADADRRHHYRDQVNWDRLADFADVRGIRIEDDVLITETGSEVLSAALPTEIAAIEQLTAR
jgi:Xaa-Pro aminopeptidase